MGTDELLTTKFGKLFVLFLFLFSGGGDLAL